MLETSNAYQWKLFHFLIRNRMWYEWRLGFICTNLKLKFGGAAITIYIIFWNGASVYLLSRKLLLF